MALRKPSLSVWKNLRPLWPAWAFTAFALVFLTTAARADSITFDDGGTLTGSFTFDATTNTITAWNFFVTGGSANFSTLTYSNTVAGSVASFGGFDGAGFAPFSFYSPTGGDDPGTAFNGRTLQFVVPGSPTSPSFPASELPGPGQTLQLVLSTASNPNGATCGSLNTGATACSSEGEEVGFRNIVSPAFVDITDPACTGSDTCYTFTYTSIALTGGGGGGGVAILFPSLPAS
ncbi:MAG TPA: hypothetical protein VKW78_01805 [Terriglobales bacterium]|nr:hypothetical protein [Terriglobales bacterium]